MRIAAVAVATLLAQAGAVFAPPYAAYGPGPYAWAAAGAYPAYFVPAASFLQLRALQDGEGSGTQSPYEYYFHHDMWGRVVTAPRGLSPQHSHRWMANMDGRSEAELAMERAAINGHSGHVYGAQYVEPCPTFPYCNYIPPPPPLMPPPYRLSAPQPRTTFPSLGVPHTLPWEHKKGQSPVSSGPMIQQNPNNLNPVRPSVSAEDERMWKLDMQREEADVSKAAAAGGGSKTKL